MYIYGKNASKDAILKENIKKAFVYKNFKENEIITLLKNKNVKTEYLEKYELDKIQKGNHQGIILEVEDYKYYSLDDITDDTIVMLDHLEDPHNFGAIIRTCEAAGIKNIIIPKDRSVKVTSTVIKVSVGAIENVKIIMVSNLVNTINKLKSKGYWIIGTDMVGEDYRQIDYTGKTVIVIGSEGNGLSRLIEEKCDFIASIPMKGKVNSLNASVAAALVIYESQRGKINV